MYKIPIIKGGNILAILLIFIVSSGILSANENTLLPKKNSSGLLINQHKHSSDFKLSDIKVEAINITKLLSELENNKLIVVEKKVVSNSWGHVKEVIDIILPPLTVIVAFFGIWLGYRQYKFTIFTRDWAELMKYLLKNAKYMDESKTSTYKTSYIDNELIEYEIIARLCIAYLDDMWFMNSKKRFENWFKGSVILFSGRHKAWLKDNKDSYDEDFYNYIITKI